jgi:predicted AAA+ superfamily ATPase
MIQRTIKKTVQDHLGRGKIIILYGARRVGKTTLAKEIGSEHGNWSYLSCDEPNVRDGLTNKTSRELKSFIGESKLVVIDEAQRVPNIGITLKLLIDTYPDLRIIATGSSSFDLANKIREPLTGRAFTFHLYPFSLTELAAFYPRTELDALIPERVLLGMYPAIAMANQEEATSELRTISADYLYRDLLAYNGIRKPELLEKLIRLLAMQTGSLVSYTELGDTLRVSRQTVESYVRILEQAFIIFTVTPFTRNLRSELSKKRKIYFYDTGIRNAILDNLSSIDRRTDIGPLWENFVIAERLKLLNNSGRYRHMHFWRTHDGQEIDLVEVEGEDIHAFEIKWQHPRQYSPPPKWSDGYKDIPVVLITRNGVFDHLIEKGWRNKNTDAFESV